MKKQLGILILVFLAAVGFSGAVSAHSTANSVFSGPIINSPGTTVDGGNYFSNGSGDVTNSIKSTSKKKTTTYGKNGNNVKIGTIIP